jgi:hypothetical protein
VLRKVRIILNSWVMASCELVAIMGLIARPLVIIGLMARLLAMTSGATGAFNWAKLACCVPSKLTDCAVGFRAALNGNL